jgi:hypothetical protein
MRSRRSAHGWRNSCFYRTFSRRSISSAACEHDNGENGEAAHAGSLAARRAPQGGATDGLMMPIENRRSQGFYRKRPTPVTGENLHRHVVDFPVRLGCLHKPITISGGIGGENPSARIWHGLGV